MPVRFHKSGHIQDDDAKTWDADAMLEHFREDTEEQNRERLKSGQPGVQIVGWSQPPRYDAATQRLAWAMTSRPAGARSDDSLDVNYNTCVLGRDGYFSLNMVTSLQALDTLRSVADQQIAALEFKPGKRYADFDAKSDRAAEVGLTALVISDASAGRPGFVATAMAFIVRYATSLLVAGGLLGACVVMGVRRRRPAAPPRPVFANTVAGSPVIPEVDLEAGDAGTPPPPSPHGA